MNPGFEPHLHIFPTDAAFLCRAPLRKHYGRGLIGSSHLALPLASALIFLRFEHNSEASFVFTRYLQGSVCTSFQLLARVFSDSRFHLFFFRFYSYLCDLFGVTLDPFQHPVKISFLVFPEPLFPGVLLRWCPSASPSAPPVNPLKGRLWD